MWCLWRTLWQLNYLINWAHAIWHHRIEFYHAQWAYAQSKKSSTLWLNDKDSWTYDKYSMVWVDHLGGNLSKHFFANTGMIQTQQWCHTIIQKHHNHQIPLQQSNATRFPNCHHSFTLHTIWITNTNFVLDSQPVYWIHNSIHDTFQNYHLDKHLN